MKLDSANYKPGRPRKVLAALAGAFVALATHGAAQAAPFTSYTNLGTWAAATSGTVVVEDFSDATLLAGFTASNGSIGGGSFAGLANTQFNDIGNPRWNFAPSKAFSADFDLSPDGIGNGLLLVFGFADGSSGTYNVLNTATSAFVGFLGFVSSVDFTSVRFDSFATGRENFSADNARFVTAGSTGGGGGGNVPEPASLALCGVALATMASLRKRAKTGNREPVAPTAA